MTNCIQESFVFPGCKGRRIEASFEGGDITSDGGVLLLRQVDRRLHEVLLEGFIGSFKRAPRKLVLDFDATDDRVHGQQEGRFFQEITDKLCKVAIDETASGVFEGAVFARVMQTIYENDGDPPALRNPMGCGDAAPLGRYVTGRKHVTDNDQFKFELGCGYRHYHTANLFNVVTGPNVDPAYHRLHEAAKDAIEQLQATARAGNTVADLFETHRRVFAEHGLEDGILFFCGYQMGISFPPTWVGTPMIIQATPLVLQPGMSFFAHLVSRVGGIAHGLGEQFIVTENQPEIITHVSRELIVKN